MVDPNNDIIAVMGATGTGKTTFINLVSGSDLRVGMGLHSCTDKIETSPPFQLYGRTFTLIDTPGFDDTTKTDTAILRLISDYLSQQYSQGIKLSGVIYMHRISDFRMGGISTRNFKMFRSLCGDSDNTLKNVIITSNMWGEVSQEIGEAREAELARDDLFFKPVLDKKARLARHDGTLTSAQGILKSLIGNEPEALRIQTEIVDEKKDSSETAAAAVLNAELIEQARLHEEEKQRVRAETEAAMQEQAEARRAKEQEEQRRIQDDIARAEAEAQRQAEELRAENARIEKKMQEDAERARLEAERVAAEHQRKLDEEAERVRKREEAEAAERAALQAAIARQAEEARKKREAEDRRRQEEIARAEEEARREEANIRAERARLEREMREEARRARLRAERAAAEHRRRMEEEAERAREREREAAAERARVARQLEEEKRRQAELENDSDDDTFCIIV